MVLPRKLHGCPQNLKSSVESIFLNVATWCYLSSSGHKPREKRAIAVMIETVPKKEGKDNLTCIDWEGRKRKNMDGKGKGVGLIMFPFCTETH